MPPRTLARRFKTAAKTGVDGCMGLFCSSKPLPFFCRRVCSHLKTRYLSSLAPMHIIAHPLTAVSSVVRVGQSYQKNGRARERGCIQCGLRLCLLVSSNKCMLPLLLGVLLTIGCDVGGDEAAADNRCAHRPPPTQPLSFTAARLKEYGLLQPSSRADALPPA